MPRARRAGAEGDAANMPAAWIHYEDPDGHDNTEVFALKEASSEEAAYNSGFGQAGFNVNGKWYKVIGLWTVNPASDILDKGDGTKAVQTPLYFSDSKPAEGDKFLLGLWDYDYVPAGAAEGTPKGGLSNLVEVTAPPEGGQVSIVVEDEPSGEKIAQVPVATI